MPADHRDLEHLAARIQALSPSQRAILERHLAQNFPSKSPARLAAIPRRENSSSYPLSFAQQRLWVHALLVQAPGLYVEAQALRMVGPLRVDSLRQAMREIVNRHEIVRARFCDRGGRPEQHIAPPIDDLQITEDDLTLEPEGDRLAAVKARLQSAIHAQFDLANGPLLRVRLMRLAPCDHLLVVIVHHLVCDGWSIGILIRELAELYGELASGRAASLPALPIQYSDYAAWERKSLAGERLSTLVAFWRQQLDGMPAEWLLPTDRPRPAKPSFRGARPTFALPRELHRRVLEFGHQHNGTPFMTLLAAFATLLYRYSARDTIVIGIPVANRTYPGLDGLIGFFVNTLPLRLRLSDQITFRALFDQVARCARAAFDHQELPLELLPRTVAPSGRSSSGASLPPLVQIMFAMQNVPLPTRSAADVQFTFMPLELDRGIAMFDLLLTVFESDDGLSGSFEYSTDLFDALTVAGMIEHYRSVLAEALNDPDRSLLDLVACNQTTPLCATSEHPPEEVSFDW